MLKKKKSNVILAKVDISVEKNIAEEYSVTTYPTLKFFKDSKIIDYKHPRTSYIIVDWLLKKSGFGSSPIQKMSDFQNIIDSYDAVAILYLDNDSDDKLQTFQKAAEDFDSINFFHTTVDEFRESQGDQGKNVVIFKKFDEPKSAMETEFNLVNL